MYICTYLQLYLKSGAAQITEVSKFLKIDIPLLIPSPEHTPQAKQRQSCAPNILQFNIRLKSADNSVSTPAASVIGKHRQSSETTRRNQLAQHLSRTGPAQTTRPQRGARARRLWKASLIAHTPRKSQLLHHLAGYIVAWFVGWLVRCYATLVPSGRLQKD